MIKAIFFAIFDVEEGPKVLHQVPPGSIDLTTTSLSNSNSLLNFPTLSSYLIPAPTLSNQPLRLLTPTKPPYRLLSHPTTLHSPTYPRNAFTFNFILVLPSTLGFHTYLPLASKLASLFSALESQCRFLSLETSLHPTSNTGRIYAIIEQVLEDLNNYSECMIPIDGTTTTINIKLFPIYPPPPQVQAWHVPLLIVDVKGMRDPSWDLTLLRILPFIDGVRSVKKIAIEADADFKLVRKAIRHLLYYGCATLLDIFAFSAIYASTESINSFIESEELQQECRNYVIIPALPTLPRPLSSRSHNTHNDAEQYRGNEGSDNDVTGTRLIELYISLRQGQSLRSWILETDPLLPKKLDIRRFITFGVIKGFLYRVHRYAIAGFAISASTRGKGKMVGQLKAGLAGNSKNDRRNGKPRVGAGFRVGSKPEELSQYLDGTHSFDEICTELMISEKVLMGQLKAWDGDMQIICR